MLPSIQRLELICVPSHENAPSIGKDSLITQDTTSEYPICVFTHTCDSTDNVTFYLVMRNKQIIIFQTFLPCFNFIKRA